MGEIYRENENWKAVLKGIWKDLSDGKTQLLKKQFSN